MQASVSLSMKARRYGENAWRRRESFPLACLCGLYVLLLAAPLHAAGLPRDVESIIDNFSGRIYFSAKDLKTGHTIEHNADKQVQTASVIKIPIMVEVFAQAQANRFTLQDVMAYTAENRAPGSGILQDLDLGLKLTIKDLVTLMIVLSDNTATNILIDRVGIEAVNDRMRRIGLSHTLLNKKVFRPAPDSLPEEREKWGLGVTTAREMLMLLEAIYRKEVVGRSSCEEMIAIMKKQRDRNQVPRLLVGKEWEKIEIAHKTGTLERVRNDVALVFTPDGDFILSLFAQGSHDTQWTPDNEATLTLARLAQSLLRHFKASAIQ